MVLALTPQETAYHERTELEDPQRHMGFQPRPLVSFSNIFIDCFPINYLKAQYHLLKRLQNS